MFTYSLHFHFSSGCSSCLGWFCGVAEVIFLVIRLLFYCCVVRGRASCICGIVCSRCCFLWISWRRNLTRSLSVSAEDVLLASKYRILCGLCGRGSGSRSLAVGSRARIRGFSRCMCIFLLIYVIIIWTFLREGGNCQNGLSIHARQGRWGMFVWIRSWGDRYLWVERLHLEIEWRQDLYQVLFPFFP